MLDRLAPAERIAFVMHDMFDLPFDDIAGILGRSPAAARQLASRARRRVQGAEAPEVERTRRREVVEAFLAAAQGGDFSALLAVLDPDVVLRADPAAIAASLARAGHGGPVLAPELRGPETVANVFHGRASAAQPALVDGDPGLVFAPGGRVVVAFDFVIENGQVVELSLIADPAAIAALDLAF
jgi:ketosteroid isomerase-like protein